MPRPAGEPVAEDALRPERHPGGRLPSTVQRVDAWAGNSNAKRASIKRGQDIFNTPQFILSNVAGINDRSPPGGEDPSNAVPLTCGLCHNQKGAGSMCFPRLPA